MSNALPTRCQLPEGPFAPEVTPLYWSCALWVLWKATPSALPGITSDPEGPSPLHRAAILVWLPFGGAAIL